MYLLDSNVISELRKGKAKPSAEVRAWAAQRNIGGLYLSAISVMELEMGARLEEIAGTIHAHPTQGEAFPEAALKALGHALHI